MSHRPPLHKRFWVYSAVAYLAPIIMQILLPEDPGFSDELVWLVTLTPAFLLSLHYGMRGAVAGLVMGTVLFGVVQVVIALNFTPDDWRITTPIYVAYGTLAISVGWLSEELHVYYQRALKNERLAAIGQAAIAIRHELSDGLSVIAAQSEIVSSAGVPLAAEQSTAARMIRDSAHHCAATLQRLTHLEESLPPVRLASGVEALDLDAEP